MKMTFGILISGFLLIFAGGLYAQDSQVSFDAALDGYSGYIWRGGVLGADDKAVLQPSATVGFGESGVALNIWGSFFAQSRSSLDSADELDLTLSLDRPLGEDSPVSFSIGYIQYTFPSASSGSKHSEEVYGGISLDHSLAPSMTLYYDFGLTDGWYFTAGIGPEFPLGEEEGGPTFSLGASASLSNYGGDSAWNDVTVTGSVNFSSGQFSISPMVGFCVSNKDIYTSDQSFWGGISIGFTPGGE